MAISVFTTPQVILNSVDLTNHIVQVKLEEKYADVDTTAFGSGSKTRIAGLGDHSVAIDFQQDFASSSVESTIYPLVGTTTSITIKPLSSTTSSTNPAYTFTVLVNDWIPVGGKVGDLLVASVTWPVSGGISKAFS